MNLFSKIKSKFSKTISKKETSRVPLKINERKKRKISHGKDAGDIKAELVTEEIKRIEVSIEPREKGEPLKKDVVEIPMEVYYQITQKSGYVRLALKKDPAFKRWYYQKKKAKTLNKPITERPNVYTRKQDKIASKIKTIITQQLKIEERYDHKPYYLKDKDWSRLQLEKSRLYLDFYEIELEKRRRPINVTKESMIKRS